jgi:dTDP-4-amino-4,6-dideoxygalactose transaminase
VSGDGERRIPFLAPELPPLEGLLADLREIHASGVFSNGGPFEQRLVARLGEYLAGAHCVPVANGTLGLLLAAGALGDERRRGRGVLMPSFTFPATALAVEWAGLEPILCDVDPETWQPVIDADATRELLDELALLLPCHTFGAPVDLEPWRALAEENGLPLLIDAAAGLGGRYPDGRRLGAAGAVEVFSLQATKPFAVGEGGVIAAPSEELAERLRVLRNFGLDAGRNCVAKGINAKLSELHAAIACRVLDGFEAVLARRRAIAARYRAALEPAGFRFQRGGEGSPWQCVPVRVPAGRDRSALRARLERCGIETRHYFSPPLHEQPRYRACRRAGDLPHTDRVAAEIVSLPMSNSLEEAAVDRICAESLAWAAG